MLNAKAVKIRLLLDVPMSIGEFNTGDHDIKVNG